MPRPPSTPRPSIPEVAAWVRLHPTASQSDVARHFAIPVRWVSYNWKRIAAQERPQVVIEGPQLAGDGKRTPVDVMHADDREMALGTVRRIYKVLRIAIDRLLAQVERDTDPGLPNIDKDATTSLLNLQRIAQSMVDAHPGLLQLGGDDDPGLKEMTEDELLGHLRAIERGEA